MLPSQPVSWIENPNAVAEQTLARAQQGVAENRNDAQAMDPLRPPPITVSKGDTYWKLTGGNVAEIGMLVALNGRRSSALFEGESLSSGSLSDFSEQQVKEFEALGSAVLKQDNTRLAQLAEARLQAETASELRRLQNSAIGEQNVRYAAANARAAVDAASYSGRVAMNGYWSGVADDGVSEGSFLKYLAGRTMQFAGNVGYSLADMGIAALNNPEQALAGGLKSIVNFGPEAFNGAANLLKTSLNGYTMLAEKLGAGEGTFAGFRGTAAYNITPLFGYDNQAQAGGALLTQVALGFGLGKYGGYRLELNSGSPGTLSANPLPLRFVAPESAIGSGITFEVRNGYSYTIDSSGRTIRVQGNLTSNPAQLRDRQAQLSAGGRFRLGSDEGGHFIGRRFNGPLDDFNHFAQDVNFNRSAYRSLENVWQRALSDGLPVHVEIKASYSGSSLRPEGLRVNYSIDGQLSRASFRNKHGGQ